MRTPAALITGGGGVLSQYLLTECRKAGLEVIGAGRSLPNDTKLWDRFGFGSIEDIALERLCSGFDVRFIFHLAGSARVSPSLACPFADFTSLLPGTAKVAEFARHADTRVIFFSSAAVYGNPHSLPVTENSEVRPISPYGVHKRVAEVLLEEYARIWNLSVMSLRIFSAYGPGLRKQVLWDVANRALHAAKSGAQTVALFGTGQETRDFIYAADVARAAVYLATNSSGGGFEVVNVGSGIESSIHDVVLQLLDGLGVRLSLRFDGKHREGDPVAWRADICRLRNAGFISAMKLDDGIARLAKWILEVAQPVLAGPAQNKVACSGSANGPLNLDCTSICESTSELGP